MTWLLIFSLLISTRSVFSAENTYDNYCFASTLPQNYLPPSEGDQMVQIQLITRHGDRTPINLIPNENVEWRCDVHEATVALPLVEATSPMERIHDIPSLSDNPYSSYLWKGSCLTGQLTEKGMKQHQSLGSRARQVYIEQLGFLPDSLNQQEIYVRSTDYPRTKQSAENFFQGLYPKSNQNSRSWLLNVYPREIETLIVNSDRCPKVASLDSSCYERKEYQDYLMRNKDLKERVQLIIPGVSKTSFGAEADIVACRTCHEKVLPCSKTDPNNCITEEMALQIKENIDWEYDYTYRVCPSELHKSLRMGAFIKEMAANIDKALKQETDIKFYHYSAHDTTIAPILGSLGAERVDWPPYASNIYVELWRDSEGQDFIRVFYNGQILNATWCDMNRCPVKNFLDYVGGVIPLNFEKDCQV